MNTLTDKQSLRYDLLKANNYDVENSKACYDFVAGNETMDAPVQTDKKLADGIYIIDVKGNAVPFIGENTETLHDTAYIGIVCGNHSVAVALRDMAGGEDITLTKEKDKDDGQHIKKYVDAVQDWNGKENTEHLKAVGLNDKIKLKDGEYIPTLAELYLICLHRKQVNEALQFVGAQPIGDLWYWTSTECSATLAWYLYLNLGYAYYNTKATNKHRVRAVSAFLPLNF